MMCRFWTNFAKHGDPTPNDDKSHSVKWNYARSIDRDAFNEDVIIDYLKIDNDEVKMYKNMYKERIDFWRGVYAKYNQSYLNPKYPEKLKAS
jgi:Carboxylesterase family